MNAAACPACGTALAEEARFCSACGARVAEREEAHSRFMTVLFCDLAGSTSMTGALGDEAMFDLIRRYQQICGHVTGEFGGYVAKYMGDGMLAYFGYPDAMKNSAAQAALAALEIVQRAAGITLPDGTPLRASAGVATGWMVVGDTHADAAAAEIMAIGSTVNLASRLQSEAGPGRVAVSSDTGLRLDAARFALTRLGERDIRGFAAPLEVWLIEKADAKAPAAAFVGRGDLRRTLEETWRRACRGEVRFVEITAPGGYGKTALARSFLRQAVDESRVFWLRGEHHRREQSFAAFRRLVRELAGVRTAAAPKTQMAALEAWAPPGALGGLAMLCDLDTAGPVPAIMRSERIGAALNAALAQRLPGAPAVLFVDDAHWLDADSMQLISDLPSALQGRPLMVLMTRRPEGETVAVPGRINIHLDALSTDEALGVIAALDADGIIQDAARRQIAARARGVPLFLEHITRAVLERPDHRIDDAIPVTMIEALHERFTHLGDALALVEAAAVLGTELRVDVLAAMLERGEAAVSQQMSRLIRCGLFRPRGNGTIAFDHALIRDAVLDTLLSAKTRALHAKALAAYEAAAPRRLARNPLIAARHLMCSGREAEGIPQLLAAAQAALMRGEIAESVRLLKWAEEGLDALPADAALRSALEMAVQFSLGVSLVQHLGFSDQGVARAYERALELCLADERHGESEFQIAWGIWAHYMVVGNTERAHQMTRRMDHIAAQEPLLEVLAAAARSLVLCNRGELAAQEEAAARVEALYAPKAHRLHALTYSMDSLELAHLFRIHARWIAGDLAGWQAAFKAARDHEAFLELPILKPYVRIYSTAPNTYALCPNDYRDELEEATAYAAEIGQPFWVTAGRIWLAHEAVRSKGPAAALEEMQAAVAGMRAIGLKLGGAYQDATLGLCLAASGAHDEAAAEIAQALDAIGAGRDLVYGPEVCRLAAEIKLLKGAREASAKALLDEAAARAEALGARAWSALIAASQARLKAAAVGQDAAQAWLADTLAGIVPPGSQEHPAFVTARKAFEHPI